MRSRKNLVLVVLAMMVLAGCAKTIEVKLSVDEFGNPVLDERGNPEFDKKFHETAVVGPGDRIVWFCSNCPAGTEFTVTGPRFVAELDQVTNLFQELESVQRGLTVLEQKGDASGAVTEGSAPFQEAIAQLTKLKSYLSADEGRQLFTKTWQALGEFVDGRKRLHGPGRVTKGIGNSLWKFTWKVRLKGRTEWVEWDPHIVGHEDYRP